MMLSFPKIISGRNGGAAPTRSGLRRWHRHLPEHRSLIAAAIAPLHRAAGPIGIFELVLPAEPAVARGAGHALLEGIKAAVRSAALDGFCAPRRSRGCIGAQHEGGEQDGCHGEGAHEV